MGFHLYDCCCSVAESCPILCDHVDCSTPGFHLGIKFLISLALKILQNLVALSLDLVWHNFKTKGEGRLEECVCAKSFQLCPTLCDCMDHSLPASSVHWIL